MACKATNSKEEKYEITCKPESDFQGNIHQASGNFNDTSLTLNLMKGKDSVKINTMDGNPSKAYFRKNSSGLSGGAIAGIVIGLVAALIIFAIIVLYLKEPNPSALPYPPQCSWTSHRTSRSLRACTQAWDLSGHRTFNWFWNIIIRIYTCII